MLLSMNAVCGNVAGRALALAQEDALARELLFARLARVEPARRTSSLGAGGKSMHVLHLRHHRDLIGAVWQIHALFGSR